MRILHLLDGACGWEERLAVGQILDRLDRNEHPQIVASLDIGVPRNDVFNGTPIIRCPDRFGLGIVSAPRVRRLLAKHAIDVIVAWGNRAASAAIASRPDQVPLIVQRFAPRVSDREARFLRTVACARRTAIACTTGTVQRRLIEAGAPTERCVLIRPGVDFGLINRVKRDDDVRSSLGIAAEERLILMSPPTSREGYHDRLVWCQYFFGILDISDRIVVPGGGSEVDRLRRLVHSSGLVMPVFGGNLEMEELITSADVLVVPAGGDVSTTCIAWAMAAYVPVVATAVYSVAELIAHKSNGLLIKPEKGPGMALQFISHLQRMGDLRKEKETARGQAYEVFGIRRFVDQEVRLIENLLADQSPAAGIGDSAVTA